MSAAKKQRTPQEKKALSYDKDHVVWAQSVHGHRKNYPRLKARASRNERREVRQQLGVLTDTGNEDQIGDFPIKPVRRKQVRKTGPVMPLKAVVKMDQFQRISRTTWGFLDEEYDTARHAVRFSDHLNYLIKYVPQFAPEFAHTFGRILEWIPAAGWSGEFWVSWHRKRLRSWFEAFFADRPEWRDRLKDWVVETATSTPVLS